MTAVYRLAEKKCATCRWWNGPRGIDFRANKPYYVKTASAPAPCLAKRATTTPANTCLRWTAWEKLLP